MFIGEELELQEYTRFIGVTVEGNSKKNKTSSFKRADCSN